MSNPNPFGNSLFGQQETEEERRRRLRQPPVQNVQGRTPNARPVLARSAPGAQRSNPIGLRGITATAQAPAGVKPGLSGALDTLNQHRDAFGNVVDQRSQGLVITDALKRQQRTMEARAQAQPAPQQPLNDTGPLNPLLSQTSLAVRLNRASNPVQPFVPATTPAAMPQDATAAYAPKAPERAQVGAYEGTPEEYERGTRRFDEAVDRRNDFLRQSPQMRAADRFAGGVTEGVFMGRTNQILGALDPERTTQDYDNRQSALPKPTDAEALAQTAGGFAGMALPFSGASRATRTIGARLAPEAAEALNATRAGRAFAGAAENVGLGTVHRGALDDPDLFHHALQNAAMGAGFGLLHGNAPEPAAARPRDPRSIRLNQRMDEALGVTQPREPVVRDRPDTNVFHVEQGTRSFPRSEPAFDAVERARPAEPMGGGSTRTVRGPQDTGGASEGFTLPGVATTLAGVGMGGTAGMLADDEHPLRGAALGAVAGGLGGYGLSRLAENATAPERAAYRASMGEPNYPLRRKMSREELANVDPSFRELVGVIESANTLPEGGRTEAAQFRHAWDDGVSATIHAERRGGGVTYVLQEHGGAEPRRLEFDGAGDALAMAKQMLFVTPDLNFGYPYKGHGGEHLVPASKLAGEMTDEQIIAARGEMPDYTSPPSGRPVPTPPIHPSLMRGAIEPHWRDWSARFPEDAATVRGILPDVRPDGDASWDGRGRVIRYNQDRAIPDRPLMFHEGTHAAQSRANPSRFDHGITPESALADEIEAQWHERAAARLGASAQRVRDAAEGAPSYVAPIAGSAAGSLYGVTRPADSARERAANTFAYGVLGGGAGMLATEVLHDLLPGGRYANNLGAVGPRPDNFGDLPPSWKPNANRTAETTSQANAYELGRTAAREGVARDVHNFPEGSREARDFDRGWRAEQQPTIGQRIAGSLRRAATDTRGVIGAPDPPSMRALRLPDGRVVTGENHGIALNNAVDQGMVSPDILNLPDSEWPRHFEEGAMVGGEFVPRAKGQGAPVGERFVAEPLERGRWRVVDTQSGQVIEEGIGGFDGQRTAQAIARRWNTQPKTVSAPGHSSAWERGREDALRRRSPDARKLGEGESRNDYYDGYNEAVDEYEASGQVHPINGGPRVHEPASDRLSRRMMSQLDDTGALGERRRLTSARTEDGRSIIGPESAEVAAARDAVDAVIGDLQSRYTLGFGQRVEDVLPPEDLRRLTDAQAAYDSALEANRQQIIAAWRRNNAGSAGGDAMGARLMGGMVGGVGGAAYGYGQGDDTGERIGNALAYGAAGALGGAGLAEGYSRAASRALPEGVSRWVGENIGQGSFPLREGEAGALGDVNRLRVRQNADGSVSVNGRLYASMDEARAFESGPVPAIDDAERALAEAFGERRPSTRDYGALATGEMQPREFAQRYGVEPRVAVDFRRAAEVAEAEAGAGASPLDDPALADARPRPAQRDLGEALPDAEPMNDVPDDGFLPQDAPERRYGSGGGQTGKSVFSPEGAMAVRRAGLLTNVSGIARDVGQNAVPTETAASAVADPIDRMLSLYSGKRSAAFSLRAVGEAAYRGATTGFADMARKARGRPVSEVGASGAEAASRGVEGADRRVMANPFFDAYVRTVGQIRGAVDMPAAVYARTRAIDELAYVTATNEGLRGSARRARIAELKASPTEEMNTLADAAVAVSTFTNESVAGRAVKGLREGFNGDSQGRKDLPIARAAVDFFVPFRQVPGALAGMTAQMSPFGTLKFGRDFVRWFKAVRANAPAAEIVPLQRAVAQAGGRVVVGAGIVSAGGMLYNAGMMTDATPDAGQRREGAMPFSVKIGGRWIPVAELPPVGPLLAMGAEYQSRAANGFWNQALSGSREMGKSVLDATLVRGMGDVQKIVERPRGNDALGRSGMQVVNSAASSFVPTMIGQIATGADGVQRTPENPIQAIEARIPGLRQRVPAKVDPATGEPVRTGPGGVRGVLKQTLDFTRSRSAESSGVNQWLSQNNYSVPELKRSHGESDQGYRRRQAVVGRRVRQALEGLSSTRRPQDPYVRSRWNMMRSAEIRAHQWLRTHPGEDWESKEANGYVGRDPRMIAADDRQHIVRQTISHVRTRYTKEQGTQERRNRIRH